MKNLRRLKSFARDLSAGTRDAIVSYKNNFCGSDLRRLVMMVSPAATSAYFFGVESTASKAVIGVIYLAYGMIEAKSMDSILANHKTSLTDAIERASNRYNPLQL